MTTPWGDAVNLDGPGSDAVRRMIIEDAVRWIEVHHVDGLRIDAVHAFVDRSAMHIVEEIAAAVHAAGQRAGRTTWVIAESDLNDPRVVRQCRLMIEGALQELIDIELARREGFEISDLEPPPDRW